MNSNKKTARTAGILYLALAAAGGFGIMYVPSEIIVADDALATASNIMANEMLFRVGIVSQLLCQVFFVYLVLALYRLFKEVNQNYALQMVALVVVSVPISFLIMLNQLAALILLSDADFLTSFEPDQLNALVMIFFKIYEQGVVIVQVFWGLWLIPFGVLVFKSGFIPRIFGIILIIGGIGYILASFHNLLFPHTIGAFDMIVTIPSAIGEFAIIFWFLIKGVKNQPQVADEG